MVVEVDAMFRCALSVVAMLLTALCCPAAAILLRDAPHADSMPAKPGDDLRAERHAAPSISGSPLPGIMEHQLVRTGRKGKPEIAITYPSTGRAGIDADIRQWVTGIADAFDAGLAEYDIYSEEEDAEGEDGTPPAALMGSYAITRPSSRALSLTYEIWTYTGGAHGNLDILTLNYSMLTGRRLDLVDIFEDPDAALSLMSSYAYGVLWQRLGGMRHEDILRAGLAETPENFASLTLIPTGIRINFQPYQVAPWAAGAQHVDIALEVLLPARPLLSLWGR